MAKSQEELRKELKAHYSHDAVVKRMLAKNMRLSKGLYINLAWGHKSEKDLGPEELMEIPEPLRDGD